jgi:2-dehydropantoate 2-reductase
MHFAIVGSGAVGGYYGARLQRAGHEVTFMARGAHLAAMRLNGLEIESPALGSFHLSKVRAEADASAVSGADVVMLATKSYDNDTAIPMVKTLVERGAAGAFALVLQNGVSSPSQVAAAIGEERVVAGPTYVATALEAPGRIVQTGTHRRIAFGEVFGDTSTISGRVQGLHEAFVAADIESEPHADGRRPLWRKYCFLAAFAAFTGSARLSIGRIWPDPTTREALLRMCGEIWTLARKEGVDLPDPRADIAAYIDALPPTTRASLLIDLEAGKKIEVENLLGTLVRLSEKHGVEAPVSRAFYSVLKPWEHGPA